MENGAIWSAKGSAAIFTPGLDRALARADSSENALDARRFDVPRHALGGGDEGEVDGCRAEERAGVGDSEYRAQLASAIGLLGCQARDRSVAFKDRQLPLQRSAAHSRSSLGV